MSVSIDSIQLFIPLSRTRMSKRRTQETTKPIKVSDVEILDSRLQSQVISYYESTGEVREVQEYLPFNHTDKGIITGYRILRKSMGPSTVLGLSLAITAKILKQNYLNGITLDSIQDVHRNLNDQGIILLDFNTLLSSIPEMADLKRDTEHLDISTAFNEIISRIKSQTKYRKHPNGNVTIGERKRANNSNLYIKFYDKRKELEGPSNIFNTSHKPNCPDNLLRTEITLHRKQLNEHFNPDYDNTLNSLLNGLDNKGSAVMAKILNEYLNLEPRQSNPANDNGKPNKLAITVSELVSDLIESPRYPNLKSLQDRVVEILQPGRDKRLAILNLVSTYYTIYTDAETNLQPFIKKGSIIQ